MRNKGLLKKLLLKFPENENLVWGFHKNNIDAKNVYKHIGCKIVKNPNNYDEFLDAILLSKDRKKLRYNQN